MSRPSITVSNEQIEQLFRIYRQPVLTPMARESVMEHQTMDFRDFVFVVYGETVAEVSSSELLDRMVLDHFMKRFHHPVHIAGQPVRKRYHRTRAIGWTGGRAPMTDRDSELRYTIGHPAISHSGREFLIIHAVAPDLESPDSGDYRRLVDGSDVFDLPGYRRLYRRMVEAIVQTARQIGAERIVTPLIGLGAFLTAVREIRTEIEFEALVIWDEYAEKYPITVAVAPGSRLPPRTGEWRFEVITDLFTTLETYPTGRVAVVNAWDPKSLIGNGLLDDPTIDGWLVSGRRPRGGREESHPMPNSSFRANGVLAKAARFFFER